MVYETRESGFAVLNKSIGGLSKTRVKLSVDINFAHLFAETEAENIIFRNKSFNEIWNRVAYSFRIHVEALGIGPCKLRKGDEELYALRF